MGLRQYRLADEIRDILADSLAKGEFFDDLLSELTITHAKLSADLQLATIYYRVFDAQKASDTQNTLSRLAPPLRRKLAKSLSIRRVPSLRFIYDESVENGARIERILFDLKPDTSQAIEDQPCV